MRKWGLALLLAAAAAFAVVGWNWGDAGRPPEADLVDAIERLTGPLPVRDLDAAGLAWSRSDPRHVLNVDSWEYRLRLDAYDPEPAAAEVKITQFLDFTENELVETGWPNGSFYDWRLLGRPRGVLARLRAWWER